MNLPGKLKEPNFLFSLLIIVIGLVLTLQMAGKPLSDWGNYYYGSSFLVSGEFGKDVYEPYKFNLMVRRQGETDIFLNYTPIPPFTALFYVPFQLASAAASKIFFSIISVLLFAAAVYRFTNFLKVSSYLLLVIPIVLLLPYRSNIFFGQTYLLIAAMLMEGYIAYRKGKKIFPALLWSAAILLKLFPGIILLFLFFKKDLKQLGLTLGFLLLLSFITAAITGFELNIYYFTEIMPRMLNNEINDTYASSYQSMHVLLNKIFIYDKLLNPGAAFNNPYLFKIFSMLYSLTVLYICAMFTLKADEDDSLKFSLWLLAGLMITGYGSAYSLLILVFIAVVSVKYLNNNRLRLIMALGFIFMISSVPVHLFAKYPVVLQFPRLYLFVAFFFIVILCFRIRPSFKYVYSVPLLALLLGIINAPSYNENREYVFDKEEALLIYDYGESNGKLTIHFINQNGRNIKELEYQVSFAESPGLVLAGGQVFYNGRQLTFSDDSKLNPRLTAGGDIYYLSDKNRGVGFYTLRKIAPGLQAP